METVNYTIIGGDLRNIKLANFLAEDGNRVKIFGFKNRDFEIDFNEMSDLNNSIADADAVIGPMPCSIDGINLNAPFQNESVLMEDIFNIMTPKQIFMAGKINDSVVSRAKNHGIHIVDILNREEMAVLNAIPTAEGAVQIAMEEMPITLHGSNSLVLGFGRIGKILSRMLNALGSNVYVEARKHSDIAWIKSYGYTPVFITQLLKYVPSMDVIFNTVPAMIIDKLILKRTDKNCLIIDLASNPGGVDFEEAKKLGIKTIWALSLPGKVAPETAAKFIKDTIYNIMGELGV